MIPTVPSRVAGWKLAAIALAAAATHIASAQSQQAIKLDTLAVSASRTLQEAATLPSSVSVLMPSELAASQVADLRSALAQTPGLYLYGTGGVGSQSSLFLRGASSHQTLFIVDGVRMNDRSSAYQTFLGGADLGGLDRIEVLRGPQGTLYGSSAMGGVILLETSKGIDKPAGVLTAGAGSFSTFSGSAAVSGRAPYVNGSLSVARMDTANDRPGNAFRQWSTAARIEGTVGDYFVLGSTFRGQRGSYEEPGSTLWAYPGRVESENSLTTLYLRVQPWVAFNSRLTTALHKRDYDFITGYGGSPIANERRIADWQNTWTPCEGYELVGGANIEDARYLVSGSRTTDRLKAAYVSGTAKPVNGMTLSAGLRRDSFRSFGEATTWRAGLAQVVPESRTTIRATYGTGFGAPGSDDRYGVPSWGMVANPSLRAETSRGWDLGVEQELVRSKIFAGATYFNNRYRDLFDWEVVNPLTWQGRTVNRSRATTEGVEVAVRVKTGIASSHLSYTYLEALNRSTGVRLTLRPRQLADAELRLDLGSGWIVGSGMHLVTGRQDGAPMPGYATARVFASWEAMKGFLLKLRLENALDRSYEEVRGYPALPRSAYAGVEWRF